MKTTNKKFICYNAGCDIYEIEPFNSKIEWHKKEFIGGYTECMREKERQEIKSYRFNNCIPVSE